MNLIRLQNHLSGRAMKEITSAKGWKSVPAQIAINKRNWLCRSVKVIGYICNWKIWIAVWVITGTDWKVASAGEIKKILEYWIVNTKNNFSSGGICELSAALPDIYLCEAGRQGSPERSSKSEKLKNPYSNQRIDNFAGWSLEQNSKSEKN